MPARAAKVLHVGGANANTSDLATAIADAGPSDRIDMGGTQVLAAGQLAVAGKHVSLARAGGSRSRPLVLFEAPATVRGDSGIWSIEDGSLPAIPGRA